MRETVSALHLNPSQIAQLIGFCTAYRSSLWRSVMPTPERNQVIRCVQALQGRLEKAQEQGQTNVVLTLSGEERMALQQLLLVLMQQCSQEPPSAERTQKLGELGSLRVLVERALRQTQAF
jgi:hypothetical protein